MVLKFIKLLLNVDYLKNLNKNILEVKEDNLDAESFGENLDENIVSNLNKLKTIDIKFPLNSHPLIKEVTVWSALKLVSIYFIKTKGSTLYFRDIFPFKTGDISHALNDYEIWDIDLDEYYYYLDKKDDYSVFILEKVSELIKFISEINDISLYQDILVKYELVILTLLNVSESSMDINGKIIPEIRIKNMDILEKFYTELELRKSEVLVIENKIKKSANENLIDLIEMQESLLDSNLLSTTPLDLFPELNSNSDNVNNFIEVYKDFYGESESEKELKYSLDDCTGNLKLIFEKYE